AFWAAILVTFTIAMLIEPPGLRPGVLGAVANLSMLNVYVGFSPLDVVYWTLQVELAFYAAIAALLIFGLLHRIEWFCLLWMLFAAPILAIELDLSDRWESALILNYGQFFILGICVYRLRAGKATPFTAAIALGACLMSLFGGPADAPWTYLAVTVGATLLVWAATTGRARVLLFLPLLWLGDISYPLYLVHQRVGTDLMHLGHDIGLPGWFSVALAAAVVLLVAWGLHKTCEVPGRRFFRSVLSRMLIARPAVERA
ncbi:MAG: acyltransferase family protein, partial [Candidatus Eiseniibacteriota bacterium]